ncbi:MAG: SDR family NAD(P)-dependent oxidoreductase, partial [Paralcaligenes sp.]
MFDLSGQIAFITGSSRGIGYAAAQALGRQGATVIINGRDATVLEQAAARLRSEGIGVHTLPFDISNVDQATQAIDQILKAVDKIDIF